MSDTMPKRDGAPFANLARAYAWLDSHVNLERRLPQVRYDSEVFGLEPFRRRLVELGDPYRGLSTIHIAGTRGKGSAALALEALLLASGQRTAVYISPHVREYRERIRIDGRPLSARRFCELLGRVAAVPGPGDEPPHPTGFKTVFENLTALFFLAARAEQVDWAVVETGLGGRLDATNVLTPGPVLWTRIGLEHTQLLGDTRGRIAREKAAILKAGGWAVCGAQEAGVGLNEDPAAVFHERTREVGAPIWEAPRLCPLLSAVYRADGQRLEFGFEERTLKLHLPFYGVFHAENLQNALAMLAALRRQGRLPSVEASLLEPALRKLHLPGRMERVCRHPEIFADGAHCPTGASALARTMQAHFGVQPAHLVLGMMADKNHDGVLAALARWPGWRRVICYRPEHERAMDADALATIARRYFDDVKVRSRLMDGLQFLSSDDEKQVRAVATGTLYSVAAIQDWGRGRKRRHERTVPAAASPESGADSGNP